MLKKWLCVLIFLFSAVAVSAQGDDIPREAAIAAAVAKLGTRPVAWIYEILTQTNNSSLGCPLVTGGDLGRQVLPYRYTLTYATGDYTVYVSSDGAVVVLCDAKFSTTPVTATPVSATPASVGTAQPVATLNPNVVIVCTATSTGAFANVRATPAINAKQVGQIFSGLAYEIVAKSSNPSDPWYYIAPGWVSGTAVKVEGTCSALAVNDSLLGTGIGLTLPSTDVNTATALQTYPCPPTFVGYLTPQIKIGAKTAKLQAGGIPNTLRSQPIANDAIGARVGTIQPNRTLDRVINGPACSGGIVWWLVEIDGKQGWTAESNFAENAYYLEATAGNEVTTVATNTTTGTTLLGAEITRRSDATALVGMASKLVFSRDGSTLLSSDALRDASGNNTFVVVEYSVANKTVTDAGMGVNGIVTDMKVLADGSIVISTAQNVYTFQKTGTTYTQTNFSPAVAGSNALFVSDDGQFVATYLCQPDANVAGACTKFMMVLRGVNDTSPLWQANLPDAKAYKILFSPDGQTIASVSLDGVTLLDRATGIQIGFVSNATATFGIRDASFNPTNSSQLATVICKENALAPQAGCTAGEITLWDLTRNQAIGVVQTNSSQPLRIAYSPKGEYILVADDTGVILVRNGTTGELVMNLYAPLVLSDKGIAIDFAMSADGKQVAMSTELGQLYYWNIATLYP